jgi:hypothetical protein
MLLIFSLGLNGVAAAAIAYLVANRPPQSPASGAGAASASALANAPAKPKSTAAAPASEAAPRAPVKQFDWRTVESTDYRQYIGNLRAIGCPEETMRDIILADVNKLFDQRRKEQRGASTNKFQYWKTGGNPLGDMLNEDRMAKNQEMTKEKRELLKSLLGENYAEKPDFAGLMNPLEDIMDFLPAGKQSEVLELEQKYGARVMGSMKDMQKGDSTAMRNVLREKDAEMAKILTPEELENYQLRLSQTAALMRMRMSEFQPSEQEFRDLFKLQKSFDDQFGIQGMQSNKPEDVQTRTASQKQLDTEIRTTLGEDRFLEYKYSQNFNNSSLAKVSDEFQVPRPSALKVFDLQAVATEQAQQVRANTALGSEQRQQALDALRAETEKEVGTLIGKPALDAYVQRGTWFKNLNKPPAGGAPKP